MDLPKGNLPAFVGYSTSRLVRPGLTQITSLFTNKYFSIRVKRRDNP